MTTHKLTTEQMKKFVDAVGGVPEPYFDGGEFSTMLLKELVESRDGFGDWPKFTDDPLVNFAVDCVVQYNSGDPEPEYDETLYAEEIEAHKATFGGFDF